MAESESVLAPLDGKSSTLFLVAGALLVVFAGFEGLKAATGTAYPGLENTFGPAGFVFGFLGVLGLYPSLADRSPKLARAGAVFVALGAVAFTVITAANFGQFVGVISEGQPAWFPVLFVMVVLGMVPGFITFGIASLRTNVYPRTLGVLLLAPGIIFVVMMIGGASGDPSKWGAFVISSGQALAHLAVGSTLQAKRDSPDQAEPAPDSAA